MLEAMFFFGIALSSLVIFISAGAIVYVEVKQRWLK
jgi:hypothetical protein